MASQSFSFFFFFFFFSSSSCTALAQSKFPAILVFGDSTVDTGNNNYISTPFQANHYPYGIDFPGHVPTGRFSDGKLVPDLLASSLGIKELVPPFLNPSLSDKEIITGVSFASAGSGFDDLTTKISGAIPMAQQLLNFLGYIKRLNVIVGEQEATKIVNGALVLISAGSNDFLVNFYGSSTRRPQLNITEYQDFILQRLQDFIKKLFDIGGRNFIVAGVPPLGCLPMQITQNLKKTDGGRDCIEEENGDVQLYNSKLVRLLRQLQESKQGSQMVYLNIYDLPLDMIYHPQKYGFVETKKGCCGSGRLEVGPICNTFTPPCANASQYLFWDSIHPGEATYKYVTQFLVHNSLLHFLS